jgi:hypothetical protein
MALLLLDLYRLPLKKKRGQLALSFHDRKVSLNNQASWKSGIELKK